MTGNFNHSKVAQAATQPWVVVLAEDDSALNYVMAIQLQTIANIVLHTATNGKQALQLILEKHPALLILDVLMPGLDGYEIVATLRDNPEFCSLPIVVHTSYDLSIQQQLLLTLGPTHFIRKAGALNQLVEVVQQALFLHGD